jgi:hypothetical protein
MKLNTTNIFFLSVSDQEFAVKIGIFLCGYVALHVCSSIAWKCFTNYEAKHSHLPPTAFRERWAVELNATGQRLYIVDDSRHKGQRIIAHPDEAWREFCYPMINNPSLGEYCDRWNLSMATALAASLRDARPGEDWQPKQVSRYHGPFVWLLLIAASLGFLYVLTR